LFSGDCLKPFDAVMVTDNSCTVFGCIIRSKLRTELVGTIHRFSFPFFFDRSATRPSSNHRFRVVKPAQFFAISRPQFPNRITVAQIELRSPEVERREPTTHFRQDQHAL
jgi:hypothetical protein